MQYRRSQAKGATFFFTVVTDKRKSLFYTEENITLINEAFEHIRSKYPFTVDAYVILPDHIHYIWTLPEHDCDFSIRWRLIKTYFTKRCLKSLKESGNASKLSKAEHGVWQRRFWEHRIRDENDFARHVDYIHYNPVKHGLVASPSDWAHSSFSRYVKLGVYGDDWGAGSKVDFEADVGHE